MLSYILCCFQVLACYYYFYFFPFSSIFFSLSSSPLLSPDIRGLKVCDLLFLFTVVLIFIYTSDVVTIIFNLFRFLVVYAGLRGVLALSFHLLLFFCLPTSYPSFPLMWNTGITSSLPHLPIIILITF